MNDPNVGWLDQSCAGAPTLTNRDAVIAAGGFPHTAASEPSTPERARSRRRRRRQSLTLAGLAILFAIGAVSDLATASRSPMPSLLAALFAASLAVGGSPRS